MATKRSRAERAARFFSLVASETRVSILLLLTQKKELPVQDVADYLGMTHSAVSHQLGLLARSAIVVSTKEGRTVRYRMATSPQSKALVRFLGAIS
jgi:ArsR family transcriptional regulator